MLVPFSARAVHEKSLNIACYNFGKLEIRTLTPKKIHKDPNYSLEILIHNHNHQQKFLRQKIVALHPCGFSN